MLDESKWKEVLFRITAPHFVAGIICDDIYLICQKAAPIVKYMVGWDLLKVQDYCHKKKWEIEKVGDPNEIE